MKLNLKPPYIYIITLSFTIYLNSLAALANYSPDELLILIVGPSARKISRDEQAIVNRLNKLRSELGMRRLRMGTMHMDRPREARFLKKVLGITEHDVVSVSVILLDAKTQRPLKNLYTLRRVTPQAIDYVQNQILDQWSRLSGIALPEDLTHHRPDTYHGNKTSTTSYQNEIPSHAQPNPPASSHHNIPYVAPQEILTSEGILAITKQAEQLTATMWQKVRNSPLRQDGQDRRVRQHLLGLREKIRLLRIALEEGRSNPKRRFEMVLDEVESFKNSDPQYFLPIPQRKKVPELLAAYRKIAQAYYQLNPQSAADGRP